MDAFLANADTVQRFIFEDAAIRGEIVHLGNSFQTICEQHEYPPQIQRLLGEALLSAVLMASIIKFKGQLTVQFQSEGPIRMLVAKCDEQYHVRGLVKFDETNLPVEIGDELSKGKLVVTIQADDRVKPYQTIIPYEHSTIAECLSAYFGASEQISTKLWLAVDEHRAAGMLIQLMPNHDTNHEREHFWDYAVKMAETITEHELTSLNNETILHRLYHEEGIRIFEPYPVSFRCTCDQKKMEDAIRTLGYEEAMLELNTNHQLAVTCEFCNKSYTFDKVDIESLFH